MGFTQRSNDENQDIWQAGSGVLKPVGSGRDGTFLKRGSGVPMSQRASRLGQYNAEEYRQRALILKPTLAGNDRIILQNSTKVRKNRKTIM